MAEPIIMLRYLYLLFLLIVQGYWILLAQSFDSLKATQAELNRYGVIIDDVYDSLTQKLGHEPSGDEENAALMPIFLADEDKQRDAMAKKQEQGSD